MGAPVEMTKSSITRARARASNSEDGHSVNEIEDPHLKSDSFDSFSFIENEGEFSLSGRQKQMLDAILKGKQYKEIAFEYGISINTVAFHISKLKERLGCGSSREIITAAILKGLVSIDKV